MISFKCEFDSRILNTRVPVEVYLPHEVNMMKDVKDYKEHFSFAPFQTVYFFHGAWDNGHQWVENTSILRLCQKANLAAVIPSVGNSFYANGKDGQRWEDFVFHELMGFVRGIFPLSDKKEHNYACGASMGGYGVLKTVFQRPEIFSRCVLLSPVVDISWSARIIHKLGVNTDYTLGKWKELPGSEYDLVKMLEDAEDRIPEFADLLFLVGSQDYMIDTNRKFQKLLDEKQVSRKYLEYEGMHDWQFWDEHIKECIDFLTAQN